MPPSPWAYILISRRLEVSEETPILRVTVWRKLFRWGVLDKTWNFVKRLRKLASTTVFTVILSFSRQIPRAHVLIPRKHRCFYFLQTRMFFGGPTVWWVVRSAAGKGGITGLHAVNLSSFLRAVHHTPVRALASVNRSVSHIVAHAHWCAFGPRETMWTLNWNWSAAGYLFMGSSVIILIFKLHFYWK